MKGKGKGDECQRDVEGGKGPPHLTASLGGDGTYEVIAAKKPRSLCKQRTTPRLAEEDRVDSDGRQPFKAISIRSARERERERESGERERERGSQRKRELPGRSVCLCAQWNASIFI